MESHLTWTILTFGPNITTINVPLPLIEFTLLDNLLSAHLELVTTELNIAIEPAEATVQINGQCLYIIVLYI